MTTFIQVLSLLVLMIVAGCQPAADATSFSTSKPRTLSRISDSVLSVRVTIDGTRHYDGRPRADGNWVIQPLGLELGVDHTVLIKWYGEYEDQTYLLVTQEGSFYADPESSQAVLNLPEVSSGSPEYDSDCDDQTNLDEFRVGSDPGTLPGCDSEPGPGPVPEPEPEPEQRPGRVGGSSFLPFCAHGFYSAGNLG